MLGRNFCTRTEPSAVGIGVWKLNPRQAQDPHNDGEVTHLNHRRQWAVVRGVAGLVGRWASGCGACGCGACGCGACGRRWLLKMGRPEDSGPYRTLSTHFRSTEGA